MIASFQRLRTRLAVLLACASFVPQFLSAQAPVGWTLIWSDEFSQPNGSAPASSNWVYDIGASGWGNNEWQYYTSRTNNSRIEDGHLVIEARQENFASSSYTSARLKTQGKWSWRYGRIEARIKIPRGQGIWPAFWMLGTNIASAGWPSCGEIDILENIGKEPTIVHGTIHGPGYSGGNAVGGPYSLANNAPFADDFHVYAVEWTTNSIQWFVDGQQYFSVTPASLPTGAAWVFTDPQFLILNLAVGGNWPGYPDATTVFPQRMTVDYVRVYAPAALTSPNTNALINAGFETGSLSSWTPYGAGFNTLHQTIKSGAVHSGNHSFKVFGRFNGTENYSGIFQDRTVEPGQVGRADAWAFTPGNDRIAGANSAWVELSFRDAAANVLALYRSRFLDSASPPGSWVRLRVDIQLNPANSAVIGTVTNLIAPANTSAMRYQVVFRQPASASGSVSFDDLRVELDPVTEVPALASFALNENGMHFRYPTCLGIPYQLQAKDQLNNPVWTPISTASGDGGVLSVPVENADDAAFFRMVRLLE